MCIWIFLQGICEKQRIYDELAIRLAWLEDQVVLAHHEHEQLTARIDSQHDPEWIELILKKRLGLVPVGQEKIYFEKQP